MKILLLRNSLENDYVIIDFFGGKERLVNLHPAEHQIRLQICNQHLILMVIIITYRKLIT